MFKPLALALVQPVAILLGLFGITTEDSTIQEILVGFAGFLSIVAFYFGPSLRSIFKFGKDAK